MASLDTPGSLQHFMANDDIDYDDYDDYDDNNDDDNGDNNVYDNDDNGDNNVYDNDDNDGDSDFDSASSSFIDEDENCDDSSASYTPLSKILEEDIECDEQLTYHTHIDREHLDSKSSSSSNNNLVQGLPAKRKRKQTERFTVVHDKEHEAWQIRTAENLGAERLSKTQYDEFEAALRYLRRYGWDRFETHSWLKANFDIALFGTRIQAGYQHANNRAYQHFTEMVASIDRPDAELGVVMPKIQQLNKMKLNICYLCGMKRRCTYEIEIPHLTQSRQNKKKQEERGDLRSGNLVDGNICDSSQNSLTRVSNIDHSGTFPLGSDCAILGQAHIQFASFLIHLSRDVDKRPINYRHEWNKLKQLETNILDAQVSKVFYPKSIGKTSSKPCKKTSTSFGKTTYKKPPTNKRTYHLRRSRT